MERKEAGASSWQEGDVPEEPEQIYEKREETQETEKTEETEEAQEEKHTEAYREFILQLRKANVHFQQLCGIPPGELSMLLTIRHIFLAKKAVIPSDIGEVMKLSRPAVSRMLHNLERKGYLHMESSREDHRYVMVRFTEKGRALIREESEKCCALLHRVAKRMGEEDMEKFLYYYSEFCSILSEEVL